MTEGVAMMDVLSCDNIYHRILQSEDRLHSRDGDLPRGELSEWKFSVRTVLAGQDINHNITVDFVTCEQGNINQD